ncbi:MAG: hypothetical protein E6R04_04265 [Spirochaetes bacterium]|nr:MAG: hypothetical protein E6R04_04265 [Spirochaetota bacterium]
MSCGCAETVDFCVKKGETFQKRFFWSDGTLTSKAISAISQAAPMVVTATGHGMVNNWRAAVVSARGMLQANAEGYPPGAAEWKRVSVIDANNVQFDEVNSADFDAYTSGGFLVYQNPVSLAGAVASLYIRDAPETGTVLATLTSSPSSGLLLDDTTKAITATLQTAALTWNIGYYDLEVTLTTGRIVQVAYGSISIT